MAEFPFNVLAESDKELGAKQTQTLERYFQIRRKSGGGECRLSQRSPTLWQVSFMEAEAQERVLEQKDHLIKTPNGDVLVTVKRDEKPWDHQSPKPQKLISKKVPSDSVGNGDQLFDKSSYNDEVAAEVTEKEVKVPEGFGPTEASKHATLFESMGPSSLHEMREAESGRTFASFQPQSVHFCESDLNKNPVPAKQSALGGTLTSIHSEPNVHSPPPADVPDESSDFRKLQSSFTLQGKTGEEESGKFNLPSVAKYMVIHEDFESQVKLRFPQLVCSLNKGQSVLKLQGLSQHVYKAELMLQDLLEGVREHVLTLSHYKIKFLKSCTPEKLKSKVLSTLDSPVTLQANKDTKLYGTSVTALEKAEEILDDVIHEAVIEIKVAARGATCTLEWTQFITSLQNEFNQSTKQVEIFSSVDNNTCSEIIIAGFGGAVKNAEQKILAYLDDNAISQDVVEIKSARIVEYFPEILDILNIGSLQVQTAIKRAPPPTVVLIGSKVHVAQAKNTIKRALDSLTWEILTISKPGAQKYFHGAGKQDCEVVSRRTNCLIKLKPSSAWEAGRIEPGDSKADQDEAHGGPNPAALSTRASESTKGKKACAKNMKELNTSKKNVTPRRDKEPDGLSEKHSLMSSKLSASGASSPSLSSATKTEGLAMGNVSIHICLGNIIMETTDVIVNSTNFFHGQTTGVAKAIFTAAGPAIAEQVAQGKIPDNGVFCTGPGNLKSRAIMHICCNNELKIIEKAVKNVILECDKRLYKSVTFPAIGTGQGGMDPRAVADAMMNGIDLATRHHSLSHLSTIRIVIFQKDTFLVFKEKFDSRIRMTVQPEKQSSLSGQSTAHSKTDKTTKPSSIHGTLETSTSFLPAVFDVVGMSASSVEKAKRELECIFQGNFQEISIHINKISSLMPNEIHKILELKAESEVEITFDQGSNNGIRVQGLAQDVQEVSNAIQLLLDSKPKNRSRDTTSTASTPGIQWYYKENGEYIPFDKDTNPVIENHFAKNNADVVVPIKGKSLLVDFAKKEATLLETKQTMKIKRVDESLDSRLPLEWDDMPQKTTVIPVELEKDSREYKEIASHFMKTAKKKHIITICRIQNPQLWQQFEVRKKYMASKNGPSEVNEKLLFHGTVLEACSATNKHGFDKSSRGQNGQYYGDGIYFAVDASCSAEDRYSQPDKNGLKYMYRARVLAGRYTKAKKGMKVPPLRSDTDLTDRYDSLVNKVPQPTVFVICNPHQAYPEYQITFR